MQPSAVYEIAAISALPLLDGEFELFLQRSIFLAFTADIKHKCTIGWAADAR